MLTEPLKNGSFYHIYGCGKNNCDLFHEPEDYQQFLNLYEKYISPVVDTYAWVLMPNHFHLLVKVKEDAMGRFHLNPFSRGEIIPKAMTPLVPINPWSVSEMMYRSENQFIHLFYAYAQEVNKRFGLTESLFQYPFKRKLISKAVYLKHVMLYIHNNPMHHGFCNDPKEYAWSSYQTRNSKKSTKLKREEIMGWFNQQADFSRMYEERIDDKVIEKWLEL